MPAVPAFADGLDQFEWGYIWPQDDGYMATDSTASGGSAAELWGPGGIDAEFTNTTTTNSIKVRAKQIQCGSASAQGAVKVDNVSVGTITVSATTWTDYTLTGPWTSGQHFIHVDYTNSYASGSCARELFLDSVVAVSPTGTPPTSPTYYVDGVSGSDSNNGTSTSTAWKTISKVNATALSAGDTVLFKRGQTFNNAALVADNPGSASSRVTYGSYGTGALPILDGGGSTGNYPVEISAVYVTVQDLQVQNAGGRDQDQVGLRVNASDALVQRVTATANAIGVQAYPGADRMRVTASNLSNNTTEIRGPNDNDDYGAEGVSILADNVQIDHNTISGNYAPYSPLNDYGTDGSAVEIFDAQGALIHHNVASGNETFTEIGGTPIAPAYTTTRTANNTFYDNLVTSTVDKAIGFNAQQAAGSGGYGPVANTKIYNNTISLTGTGAQGVLIGTGSTAALHNNIVQAEYAGWSGSDGGTIQKIDEGHNVYYATNSGNDIYSSANSGTGVASTSTTSNPVFVSSTDYHLQTTSPAKNRGTTNYGLTTDLDDNPRTYGSGTDSGCYERQSP